MCSVILVGRVSGVCADLVPDDLWERVAPLLPPAPERRRRHPGRLRVPDRTALAGVLYVLRTGVAWRDVPAETVGCSGMTAWRRLRDWTEAGVWPRLHAALLSELRRADLLDLDDCAVDGSHIRALVRLPHSDGLVCTSRLSLKTHPWLARWRACLPDRRQQGSRALTRLAMRGQRPRT